MLKRYLLGFFVCGLAVHMAVAQEAVEPAHFHHVHLNVTDPAKTIAFYKKYFGAVDIDYYDQARALFVERSFLLLNKVDSPPPFVPHTALSHMGWATIDAKSVYAWLKGHGVEFETDRASLGANEGMYIYGPDKELVEFWTGSKNHRFEHIHLWATDVAATADWFKNHLGLTGNVMPQPKLKDYENIAALRMGFLQSDNVNLVIFGRPDFDSRWWPGGSYKAEDAPKGDFKPTKGTTIDHIAYSYRDIEPVYERMKAAGANIVGPIARREGVGHKSFFALAPDNLLVEIVQARPIPESSWDE